MIGSFIFRNSYLFYTHTCYRNSLKPSHSCFDRLNHFIRRMRYFHQQSNYIAAFTSCQRGQFESTCIGRKQCIIVMLLPPNGLNSILYILCSQNHINTLIKSLTDSFAHRIVQPGKIQITFVDMQKQT